MNLFKKSILITVSLIIALGSITCFANQSPIKRMTTASPQSKTTVTAGNQFTVVNNSGHPVYVYDVDLSAATPTQPLTANPLQPGQSLNITMQPVANPSKQVGRRIYFASDHLATIEKNGGGLLPDGFCPWNDGNVMFSLAEYLYEPANNRYTVDLSFIDEFSYPLTVKFNNVPSSYSGCQNDFEYGIKSLTKVAQALSNKGTTWGDLVWNSSNPANPGNANWQLGIHRIVGPDKVWTSQSCGGLTTYAPTSYQNFVAALPYNGNQLFGSGTTNFDGWRFSTTAPANTGYVQALHSAAIADKKGKYGFFTYCKDNSNGEFTYVPTTVNCTITVYPFDK